MGQLFVAGGFYLRRRKLAQILSQFDLGQGELTPTTFYEADKVTRKPLLITWRRNMASA